jgi:RNA polymerase sigma-B factor
MALSFESEHDDLAIRSARRMSARGDAVDQGWMWDAERTGRRAISASVVDRWCAEFYKTRDRRLRDKIVGAHQWLVLVCARRMMRRRQPLDDLVQVGNIGLLKATDRFDPAFGVSFHTFASATIVGELRRHYRSVWQVRVPRSLQERYVLVNSAVDVLTVEQRRSPTPKEVAEYLGIAVTEVLEALSIGSNTWMSSLSGGPTDDVAGTDSTMRVGDESIDAADERLEVVSLLQSLPPLERTVLYLSFCQDMKQAEIGERLGMTQLQVSRLIRRTVRALRSTQDASDGDQSVAVANC